jgi:erythromycin esterase-like protein
MRQENDERRKNGLPLLQFQGMDMQIPMLAYDDLMAYLKLVDLEAVAIIEERIACFKAYWDGSQLYCSLPKEKLYACQTMVSNGQQFLAARQQEYISKSSRKQYNLAMQNFRVIMQAQRMMSTCNFTEMFDIRDESMAQNVGWIVKESQSKAMIWAHNGHCAAIEGAFLPPAVYNVKNLGYRLKQEFGTGFVIFLFSFHHGTFSAMNIEMTKIDKWKIGPPLTVSSDYILGNATYPLFFLDVRNVTATPATQWLFER